jgi:hypothetical protein
MKGPPGQELKAAPPDKRAKPDGIPVRLYDGALVAHATQDTVERLMAAGAAESFRHGPRRYLRLRQGISVPHTAKGWDLIEFLRRWHGDKKAAAYVEHKDRESENLRYQPANWPPESRRQPPKGHGRTSQISARVPGEFAR